MVLPQVSGEEEGGEGEVTQVWFVWYNEDYSRIIYWEEHWLY